MNRAIDEIGKRAAVYRADWQAAVSEYERLAVKSQDIEVMRRRLKGDPVFEPLRNDARFRAIAESRD